MSLQVLFTVTSVGGGGGIRQIQRDQRNINFGSEVELDRFATLSRSERHLRPAHRGKWE